MNYEEKYKEALENLQKIKEANQNNYELVEFIDNKFPELKETKADWVEKIRKELKDYLGKRPLKKISESDAVNQWIDWIEKQGQIKDDSLTSEDEMRKAMHIYLDWLDGRNKDYQPKGDYTIRDMITWLEKQGEPQDKGEISDGYHTFNELYYYRMLYNAAFFNLLPKELVHKSKRHHDGEECFGGGWFIVIANLPTGQISNHYELKDWDLFQIPEKEVADEWDGHTPQEAAKRLHEYLLKKQGEQNVIPPKWMIDFLEEHRRHFSCAMDYDEKRETDGKLWSVIKWLKGNPQVEQKPTDKIEPKFKVGDIVVVKPMACHGEIIKGKPFEIVDITENDYISDNGKSYSISLQDGWELVEQKPTDKIEPKFKVGDTIEYFGKRGELDNVLHTIECINEDVYVTTSGKKIPFKYQDCYRIVKVVEQIPNVWVPSAYGINETVDNLIGIAECLEMDGDCMFNGLSGDDCGKFLRDLARKQVETWSEEDTRRLNFLIECVECCSEGKSMSMINSTALKYLDWLKALKDRVIPQQKHEWSEEDEKMLNDAIGAIGAADYYTYDDKQEIENWLKSIKNWLKPLKDRI